MWKAFWFLAVIAVLASLGAWLAGNPGEFSVIWAGYRIETSFTLVATLLIAVMALLFYGYRLLVRTIGGPGALLTYTRTRRRTMGQDALRQGLVAVAAGNPGEVRKLAAKANSLLDDPPLTLLLSAQAAQLEGDDKRAAQAYRKMLDNPETEFLGLRGLFTQSVKSGNRLEALGLAERAFELQPETPWVFNALFELQSAVGEWSSAAETLEQSVAAKHLTANVAARKRAVLYTEQALDALKKGEATEAEDWGLKAATLSPGLIPAAVLAARHHIRQGKLWKAAEVIEKAWTVSPHPDLVAPYTEARKARSVDEIKQEGAEPQEAKSDAKAQARWLKGLADFNKDHIESRILRASQDLALGRTKAARKVLGGLAENYATVRVCQLMAEVEASEPDDAEENAKAARRWLSRAVSAPRDAHWMCETCGREAGSWASTCNNCGAFDSLSWKAPADLVEALVLDPVDTSEDADDAQSTPANVPATVRDDLKDITPEDALPEVRVPVVIDVVPQAPAQKPAVAAKKIKPAEVVAPVPPRPDDPGPDADDPFADPPSDTARRDANWQDELLK